MSRRETIKQQLTDATIINQSNLRILDTTRSETVTRFKTVRSVRHAMRRLIDDAGDADLFVSTLAGRMLAATVGAASAAAWQTAINDVVTGAGSNTQFSPGDSGSPRPDDSVPAVDSMRHLISSVTVLFTDGKFYIDDLGTTGLFRPTVAKDTKTALRRVLSLSDGGVFKLNTLSGLAIKTIADLTAGSAAIGDLTAAVTDITSASTTSSSTQASLSGIPSLSSRQIFQRVLRKRSGSNRNVVVDDVGATTNVDIAGIRYSHKRMLFDLMNSDGDGVFTTSGDALLAASVLVAPAVSDIVTAVQGAVA
jgi:hypothetical protein